MSEPQTMKREGPGRSKSRGPAVRLGVFLCSTVAILVTWELAIYGFGIPEYILPRPTAVGAVLAHQGNVLMRGSAITLAEAFFGFLIGGSLGFFTAIAFVHSRPLESALYPYAIALKTVPLVGLAPILTVWFGTGLIGKIVMASLLCYFPVLVNTAAGLRSVDPVVLAYFDSLAASRTQIFFLLRLPTSLPSVFSALRISATMSLVGAVVAELTGSNEGLGYQILAATYRLETDRVFAALICCAGVGIAFFLLVVLIERWIVPWNSNRY